MIFPTFKAWVDAHESTAFTRARKAAALGTGPDIPDAAIDSHDTAPPWIKDRLTKKHKKGKDKKKDCK